MTIPMFFNNIFELMHYLWVRLFEIAIKILLFMVPWLLALVLSLILFLVILLLEESYDLLSDIIKDRRKRCD